MGRSPDRQADRQTDTLGSPVLQALLFQVETEQSGRTVHAYPLREREEGLLQSSHHTWGPACPSRKSDLGEYGDAGQDTQSAQDCGLQRDLPKVELRVGSVRPWPKPAPVRADPSAAWCRWQGRALPHKCICFPQEGPARGSWAEDGVEAWAGGLRQSAWERAPVRLAEKWVVFLLKNSEEMEK